MEHRNIIMVARQFKRTLSEQAWNTLGKSVRFCRQEREITPYRLALRSDLLLSGRRCSAPGSSGSLAARALRRHHVVEPPGPPRNGRDP